MRNYRNLALATALATLTTGAAQAVPVQWDAAVGGNDHWYELIIHSGITWTASNAAATSSSHLGEVGYLASITSVAEQVFLNTLNPANLNAWLGGTDAATEGTWEWTTGEAFAYTNWNIIEPNNLFNEDYLLGWWVHDQWNDLSENLSGFFVQAYVVEYNDAGVAPIPLPAGLPLVLGALGLLGLVGRRRKAS